MKLDHVLTSYTRIDSKWNKDLNVKLKTMKILEEYIGSTISDIIIAIFFSDISPWVSETKEKINK